MSLHSLKHRLLTSNDDLTTLELRYKDSVGASINVCQHNYTCSLPTNTLTAGGGGGRAYPQLAAVRCTLCVITLQYASLQACNARREPIAHGCQRSRGRRLIYAVFQEPGRGSMELEHLPLPAVVSGRACAALHSLSVAVWSMLTHNSPVFYCQCRLPSTAVHGRRHLVC